MRATVRLGSTALLVFLLVGVAPAKASTPDPEPNEYIVSQTSPIDDSAPRVTTSALTPIRATGEFLNLATPLSFSIANFETTPQVTATISATGASPGVLHLDAAGLTLQTTTISTTTSNSTIGGLVIRGAPSEVSTALHERLSWTAPGDLGQVTLSAVVRQDLPAHTFFNPANGHYYQFVSTTRNWTASRDAAAATSLWGLNGYLATITSPEELTFLRSHPYTAERWTGASDDSHEGIWKWATGPEAGTTFWNSSSTVRRGVNTVDGVARFNNWGDNLIGFHEPNNCNFRFILGCEDEDFGSILLSDEGRWFDRPGSFSFGAIYEFGTGAPEWIDRAETHTEIVIEVVDRLSPLIAFADANGEGLPVPAASIWTEAGITGVTNATTSAMLANALSSPDLSGSRVNTVSAAQAFVDALLRVHAFASDPITAASPALSDYETIGISGLNSATTVSLNNALRLAGSEAVANHAQLQSLAADVIAASLVPVVVPTPAPAPTDDSPQEEDQEEAQEEDQEEEAEEVITEEQEAEEPSVEEAATEPPASETAATEETPDQVVDQVVDEPAAQEITYVIAPTATGTPAGLPVVLRLDGSPLRLEPMATHALINGSEVSVSVTRLDETTIQLSGPGFQINLRSGGPNGSEPTIDESGRLVLVHDGELFIESTGYLPESRIDTWIFSTPTFLGGTSASGAGVANPTLTIPSTLSVGSHTFQITGLGPAGTPRAVSIGVLVEAAAELPTVSSPETPTAPPRPEKAPPFAPFSALDAPAALVSAAVSGMALLAVAGGAAGLRGSSSQGSRGGKATEERSELSGIDVAQLDVEIAGRSRGDNSALWRWPGTAAVDRLSVQAPLWLAPRWPMVARIVDDGSALRAMFGSLSALTPLAGVVLGLFAVLDTTGIAMPPATGLAIAIILLGTLDAFAGFLAFTVFALGVVISGGIIDVDSIRALMGIAVVFFGPALLAGAFRTIRRPPPTNGEERWERITDYAVVPLIGAMAAQAMVGALSGVAGVEFPLSAEANRIAFLVLAVLVIRIALEDAVSRWFPARLQTVTAPEKPGPSAFREGISAITKTGVYLFIVMAIIGNVWQLWLAAFMFGGPMLIGLFADRLPNSPIIWRLLPQGVPSIVTTLLISTWFAVLLEALMGETEAYARTGFVMFGLPFFAMALMGLVGREPADDEVRWSEQQRWRPVYRVGGIAMLCWGVYLHLNA